MLVKRKTEPFKTCILTYDFLRIAASSLYLASKNLHCRSGRSLFAIAGFSYLKELALKSTLTVVIRELPKGVLKNEE